MSSTTEKLRSISIALVFLALGCQDGNVPNPTGTAVRQQSPRASTPPETPAETVIIRLRFDVVATIGTLRLSLLSLDDSRCPLGVQCVWEGRVVATVAASPDDSAPQRIEIILHPGTEPVAESISGHELRLLRVEPYPSEGVAPKRGDYVASVEVRPV